MHLSPSTKLPLGVPACEVNCIFGSFQFSEPSRSGDGVGVGVDRAGSEDLDAGLSEKWREGLVLDLLEKDIIKIVSVNIKIN